jgi:indole-3-glycerol phosphate synthase
MYDNWHAIEQNLRSHLEWSRERGHLVFRNGFFNSSADILMAAELGFTGVQIHVHSMDLFELQMALELARDCRLCPIVSAANVEELELAIQTDAPHLGLCFFPEQSSHEQMQFVQQAITKIPKDCTRVLFGSIRSESELSYLSHLSFDCIFRFGD